MNLAAVNEATKEMEKHHGVTGPCALPFATRVGAKSYLDWLIPSFLSYPDKYEIQFEKLENLILEKIEEKVKEQVELDVLMNEIQKADDSICNEIKQSFSYIYPHQSEAGKKSKYSVSEIKHASMKQIYDDNLNDAEKPDFLKTEKESFVPDFAKKIDAPTFASASILLLLVDCFYRQDEVQNFVAVVYGNYTAVVQSKLHLDCFAV